LHGKAITTREGFNVCLHNGQGCLGAHSLGLDTRTNFDIVALAGSKPKSE